MQTGFKAIMSNASRITALPDGTASRLFLICFILFAADNIVNYFVHVPIFVVGALVCMPGMLYILWKRSALPLWAWAGMGWLVMSSLLNSLRGTYDTKNTADLLFILLFVQSYYLYKSEARALSEGPVRAFAIATVLLFMLPALKHLVPTTPQALPVQQVAPPNPAPVEEDAGFHVSEAFLDQYLTLHPDRKREERIYRQGFFRIPHVAAYFFGFLSIFWGFMASKSRKRMHLALTLGFLGLCISTGVRAVPAALLLSLMLYFLHRKLLGYLGGMVLVLALLIAFRQPLYSLLYGTFWEQYIQLLVIAADQFSHLSRLMLWYSWWIGVGDFQWYEWIIGRSYASGLLLNARHFGQPIWFHNDFLNMLYTYGVPGLLFYAYFLVAVYKNNRDAINRDPLLFMYMASMACLSLINGLYYYFPVLILYPFIFAAHRHPNVARSA